MATVLEEKIDSILDNEAYVSDEPEAVHAFLEEHPAVPPLLIEAIALVRHVFGETTRINLFLLDDHDSDNDVRLIAGIQTTQSVAEARKLRDRFYGDWWNANIRRANDRLFFDLEFLDG